MSGRYSLRATPRKKELYEGMVETPGRRTSRRRTPLNGIDGASDEGESSSAAETAPKKKTVARRRTGKFIEHTDDSDVADTSLELVDEAKAPNGTSNGHANGHATSEVAPPTPAKAAADKVDHKNLVDGWAPGLDKRIDYSPHFEFGGSFGALGLMIGFPALMYYMWIGATYYDGKLPLPAQDQSLSDFFSHLGHLIYTGAFPTLQAWKIYWVYYVFEAVLYIFAPGVYGYGKPLPFEDGKQLQYYCSAFVSFYITIATMAVLHFTGWFPIYTFLDEFGPIMSVGILSGFLCSFVAYFSALARGAQHRMTGYPIYDFFMGAELNPRMFGILDFKMFYEVRIPWYILFGISAAGAARQYDQYGYVTGEMWFLVMAHYLYANACSKGEQLIISTWDMYYEKWGFMLIFWNMAGVPLSYCHCTLYLANHHPSEYAWNKWALGLLFVSYLGVYCVWDQANGQKNAFRAMERGKLIKRYTFPALPWIYIDNPKTIPTSTGDSLLVDGWWGYARKIAYTCDVFFAVSWGLITGFDSPFPWFYPVFFVGMIIHRATRDIQRCRIKYGDAWKEYERQVPYLFIPYVI
ncbi:Delta(24(24(1)))-sterol reductase like protein [Microdochium trichocladiopsis]|uniref:Delta(24(24(1)))-sterol reductase n=1 Tax=Microdochium trichocladiopsis TaxID=1682393 RepID=A0A9P8XZP3_9PEZI|nr:Delta(24(24(1)))-sterol reductase like protein [Microdochium trichocladiopsis]KAH7025835.1 Delta(24(24(1)))-sterol reductase like protein [Microdochium trichocladiopsis]